MSPLPGMEQATSIITAATASSTVPSLSRLCTSDSSGLARITSSTMTPKTLMGR